MPATQNTDDRNNPLTVSQLNRRARLTIEQTFAQVWVIGELSNFARPRSGHWYFTLKDDQAQVRCAMFANRNRAVQLQPRDGHLVMVRGRVSLYEGRGDFQIIVEHMEAAGEGALRQAFEMLKTKLAAEGLFAAERKLPLPDLPTHIAVVTSPSGAALRDVLAVWQRRFPAIRVTVVPALVQGEGAEQDLLRGLQRAEALAPDVILLCRGGGSLEDLWPFNLESVARGIAHSSIPVVSGIGHEIDVTIADFAADLRAPTPSAAAEILVPDILEVRQAVHAAGAQLQKLWQQRLQVLRLSLRNLKLQLKTPEHVVLQAAQKIDDLHGRLRLSMQNRLRRTADRSRLLQQQLQQHSPARRLQVAELNTAQLATRLRQGINRRVAQHNQQLANLSRMLQSVSPLPTLSRGYALVRNEDGAVLSNIEQVSDGQVLTTHLQNGTFRSTVNKINHGEPFAGDKTG